MRSEGWNTACIHSGWQESSLPINQKHIDCDMISFTTTPNISILPESQQSNFNFRRTSSRLHLGKENLGVSYISEKCVFLFKQINKMTVRERKLAYLYAQVHRLLIKACSQGYIVVTEVMEINHEEETNGCVSMPQMIQTKMKSF